MGWHGGKIIWFTVHIIFLCRWKRGGSKVGQVVGAGLLTLDAYVQHR